MSEISKFIYWDVDRQMRVNSGGVKDDTAVVLQYQDYVTWRFYFGRMIDSVFTVIDLSEAIAWDGGVNDTWGVVTSPMVRVFDADVDKTHLADGYVDVTFDADTAPFLAKIGTSKAIFVFLEIRGYDTSGDKKFPLVFQIVAGNSIDPATGDPLDPASLYYTAAQTLALLRTAPEVQFSIDGATLWHDTQVPNVDLYYRERYPEGEWGQAIALLQGPAGADAPEVIYQYSIDGATSWHTPWATGDLYQRVSTDGGDTYEDAILFVGEDGDPGAAATIAVGTVTTGDAGTDVIVTNSGTEAAAIFDFTIPRGNTGANGNDTKLQYSADSVSWHDTYTAGDIYMHVSTDGGENYGAAMQFSSSGVNTPLEFVDGDLTTGVLTVSGLRPIIAVIDNNGKVIYPDEITYGATDTTVDLTSYGTLTGTWTVIFGQGKDGADGLDAPQDNWRVIAGTAFTATPASTSTLTMSDTSAVYVGDGIKYTDGRGTYYAIVTAVSANTSITIAGAAFDTGSDVTALYVGNNKIIQMDFFDSGTYGDGANDLLAADMNTYSKWQGRKAYLVSFSAVHKTADTGAAQPKINVKVNAAAVSTNDTNNGVQLSTAGTWVDNSAVAINTSNYDINRGEAIEITCTAAGTNGDASDLTVSLVFVQE